MEEEVEEEAVDESIECTSEELKDEEAEAKPTPKPSAKPTPKPSADYTDSSFEAPHEPSADIRAVGGTSVAGGSSVAALLQLRTGEHTAGVRSLRVACARCGWRA